MSIQIDLINEILSSTVVCQNGIIGETIFVDSNPAKVEITTVKKVNSNITKLTETKEYNLLHKGFIIHDSEREDICKKISTSIDESFMDKIDSISVEENLNYYNKGLFRIFKRNNPNIILEHINKYDWIITSVKVLSELSKLKEFIPINSDLDSSIELCGKIGELNIFVKTNIKSNYIYSGNSRETTSVFLKEITTTFDSNIYDIGVDFLFVSKYVRKLILE